MSLLGVIGKEPLRVRAGVANGSGWGCIVQNAAETWRLPAFRGGKGAFAIRTSPERWAMLSSAAAAGVAEQHVHGDLCVGTITPLGSEPLGRVGTPGAFAYEGSIDDAGALQEALDPSWAAHPSLRNPGDLVFAHICTYVAGVGALYARDVALAHATRALWRARRLGSSSFLYSDGANLYAYAAGRPLALCELPDALIVASPEIVPAGFAVRGIRDGAVVSMSRRPHLSWSVTVFADR